MSSQKSSATFSLVSVSSSIPWNTILSTPGMYLATSASYFPVFISSLISFLLFLQRHYNLRLFCPPTLSNGETVASRWISSPISLCIFIQVVEYFYFVLWLFFFFLFYNLCPLLQLLVHYQNPLHILRFYIFLV